MNPGQLSPKGRSAQLSQKRNSTTDRGCKLNQAHVGPAKLASGAQCWASRCSSQRQWQLAVFSILPLLCPIGANDNQLEEVVPWRQADLRNPVVALLPGQGGCQLRVPAAQLCTVTHTPHMLSELQFTSFHLDCHHHRGASRFYGCGCWLRQAYSRRSTLMTLQWDQYDGEKGLRADMAHKLVRRQVRRQPTHLTNPH